MAIRDFGNSLLADVRKRSDEKRDEARKYARKQDKKNLYKGIAAMAGGAFIKSAGAAITSRLAQKTTDFLANSKMADYQISVNTGEKKIASAVIVETAAKAAGLSIEDYSINQVALAKATQASIERPNEVTPNTLEDYVAAFQRNKEVIASGKLQGQYYTDVLKLAPQLKAGKETQSLKDLRSKQVPVSIVGAAWNKYVRKTDNVDVFNHTMDQMDQVIAAKGINALQFKEMAATATEAVQNGATQNMGKFIAGVLFSNEELKAIQKDIAQGSTTTETVDNVTAGNNIVQLKTTQVKDKDSNTTTSSTNEIVYKYGDQLTPSQAVALTGGIKDIRDSMANTLDGKGYGNFMLAVQEIITDPAKVTQDQYFKILALSLRPKDFLTGAKGVGGMLRPEESQVRAAREKAFLDSSKSILSSISSLGTSDDDRLEEARLLTLLGERRKSIYNITEDDMLSFTTSGQINFTPSQISRVMKANPTKDKEWARAFLENKFNI